MSISVDLTPALTRLRGTRYFRTDKITVQLLPICRRANPKPASCGRDAWKLPSFRLERHAMMTAMKKTLRSRLLRCTVQAVAAFGITVAALSMPWRAEAQQTATAQAPARITVSIPQGDGGGMATLEVVVSAFRKPTSGNIGGVVRLKRPGGGTVEVGRFSIFPAQSFTASNSGEEQRYRFDVTRALKQLGVSAGSAEVEVALIERSNGSVPPGTELQLGNAQISMR